MSTHDRYEEIRKMSVADREEIFRFAMQRSKEMLSGIESKSTSSANVTESKKVTKKDALSFR
jgi:hypothetical protein